MLITVANVKPNYYHVTREKENVQLLEHLNKEGIVIVEGEAKTGKTELVSQYYFAHKDDYKYCLWLCAGSQAELLLELQTLMNDEQTPRELRVFADDFKDLTVALKKLHKVFESLSSSWLIVIDNMAVNNLDDFFLDLPSSKNKHHVIMTLNSINKELLLSDNAPPSITLNKFTTKEIEILFAKRLKVEALAEENSQNIKELTQQVGTDLDVLVMVSRLYAEESKRTELMVINKDRSLSKEAVQQALAILRLGANPPFLDKLYLLSFFGTQAVPSKWLTGKLAKDLPSLLNTLKELGLITMVGKEAKLISLESSWQSVFASALKKMAFKDYDKLYGQALAKVAEAFIWTRTYYDKKLKTKDQPDYPKEQSQWAALTLAVLSHFKNWQEKAESAKQAYPKDTLL